MLDAILGFFSDLILFTAGLVVFTFWVGVFIFMAVEIFDLIFGENDEEEN